MVLILRKILKFNKFDLNTNFEDIKILQTDNCCPLAFTSHDKNCNNAALYRIENSAIFKSENLVRSSSANKPRLRTEQNWTVNDCNIWITLFKFKKTFRLVYYTEFQHTRPLNCVRNVKFSRRNHSSGKTLSSIQPEL